MPNNPQLRQDLLFNHHDTPMAGHPGQWRMNESITRTYWWPSLLHDVKTYVRGCESCQRNKIIRQRKHTPLHLHDTPTQPWEVISTDIIGPLPESNGYNAILAVTDKLFKMVHLIPTRAELTSEGLAKLYRDHIWKLHGLPKKIISDSGPQFAAKFMEELLKMLGISQNLSTAYHPQTDGQAERSHQETEAFLRAFVNHLQNDWSEWLAIMEFQYNDKAHSATKDTPFHLTFGRHPWKGELRLEDKNPAAKDFVTRLQKARDEALAALDHASQSMKTQVDKRRNRSRDYKIGDLVWLESANISSDRPSKKLEALRYGPFKVTAKKGASAYQLDIPKTWRAIHPVFNEYLLTPYQKPKYGIQRKNPRPEPVIV